MMNHAANVPDSHSVASALSPMLPTTGSLIKCVVWDLDETLWVGTLSEGDRLIVTETVRNVILELNHRGVLQSIASKNDHARAWDRLRALSLDHYFIHPQINWGNKSDSLKIIIQALGIGPDSVALIDDQAFERDEVGFHLPKVTLIDPIRIGELLDMPGLRPVYATNESRNRLQMYQADVQRRQDGLDFNGPRPEFLAMLGMVMTIRHATEHDLPRVEELMLRTNQFNASVRTYSQAELDTLLQSLDHDLLVAELDDRYGPSGVIGFALIQRGAACWFMELLIVSCRVLGRGAGSNLLTCILQSAASHAVRLRTAFIPNDRNRMMYITYKLSGFIEVGRHEGVTIFEHPIESIRPLPPYVKVNAPQSMRITSGS